MGGIFVCLSVRPSVCHTSVLCQNEGMQKDAVFTTGAALQIQDRSPESRPVASRNQSQMQLTRPVVIGLGFVTPPGNTMSLVF